MVYIHKKFYMIYIKRLFARFGKEKQLSTLSAQSGKQDNRGAVLNQIFLKAYPKSGDKSY